MFEITVSMKCGLDDPHWAVRGEEADRWLDRFQSEGEAVSYEPHPLLGFRGVEVHSITDAPLGNRLPDRLWFATGRAQRDEPSIEIARGLFNTSPQEPRPGDRPMTPAELQLAEETLREIVDIVNRYQTNVKRESATDPGPHPQCQFDAEEFNPHYWNDNDLRRKTNNGYAYACNLATNTYAMPGQAVRGKKKFKATDCRVGRIDRFAKSDGLTDENDCQPDANGPRYRVALALNPGQDYQWWRQSKDGRWATKAGSSLVTTNDQSGTTVFDPEKADRGAFSQFVGYFCVPQAVVDIK